MKKISISNDNKIKLCIVLVALLAELYFCCFFKEQRATMPSNIINVWQIIVHCSVVVALLTILSKMQCSVWLDDKKIRIGDVFPKSMFYSDIKNIEINERIIIHSKDNKKITKIEIIDLEDNRSKYKELLEIISERSCLDLNIDRVLNKMQKNSYKEKSKGVLGYVNAYLVVSLINLAYKFINYLGEEPNVLTIALYCGIVALNLCLIYLMLNKYKHIGKLLLGYIILRFFILHILIKTPNWILSLTENVYFDLDSNIMWTILLLINIVFIILFKHYFKVSQLSKYTFTNDRILSGNNLKKIKIVIKIGIIIIIAATIFSAYLIAVSLIKIDRNYYNSMTEIVNNKYKNTDAIIIGEENYFFVITDEEKSFVIENSEGKYIFCNNWHEETKSIKRDGEIIDIEAIDFYGSITAYSHKDYYIVLITQYVIREKNSNIVVYDTYSEWEWVERHGSKYFYKVLDSQVVDDNYEISAIIHNESYDLVNIKELCDGVIE